MNAILHAVTRLHENFWYYLCGGCCDISFCNQSKPQKFIEDYFCCIRNIWIPLPSGEGNGFDIVWFSKGKSAHIEVCSEILMFFNDNIEMRFDGLSYYSLFQSKSSIEASCCGCLRMKQEQPLTRPVINTPFNSDSMTTSEYVLYLTKKTQKKWPVSKLSLIIHQRGSYEEEKVWDMNKLFKKELTEADMEIDFLLLSVMDCEDTSVFTDLIRFKHFAVKNENPNFLNEKILSTGFLAVNGPMANPEDLSKFNGFGLLIGESQANNFGVSKVFDEIQKWKEGTSSNLEFISVFNFADDVDSLIAAILTTTPTTKRFSFDGQNEKIELKADNPEYYTLITLEENENGAAVLIYHPRDTKGVCFLRENWKKWGDVMHYLRIARIISIT